MNKVLDNQGAKPLIMANSSAKAHSPGNLYNSAATKEATPTPGANPTGNQHEDKFEATGNVKEVPAGNQLQELRQRMVDEVNQAIAQHHQ